MTSIEEGIFRSCAALSLLGAPPTIPELIQSYDQLEKRARPTLGALQAGVEVLLQKKILASQRGRYFPLAQQTNLEPVFTGEEWMPRKLRKARRVARWLSRLNGVRAVFLCNRTAFGVPRDTGDLDFFVIVRHGSIWQTRGLAGLPFVLLRDRPEAGKDERDVVCLSFFLSDKELNLSDCLLKPDDMYFRQWFLGLLPLFDDGVSEALWDANAEVRARHPFAERWILSPDLRVQAPVIRIPTCALLERAARMLQWRYFPQVLREKANHGTHVMISDSRLKFHVDDGREALQRAYLELCRSYDVTP